MKLQIQSMENSVFIESGAAATEYGFTSTAQKSFFRLRFSEAATGGNPETADLDGDHVGNIHI